MRGHEAEIMELQALMEVWGGEMTRMSGRMLKRIRVLVVHLVVVCERVRVFVLGRIIAISPRLTEICVVIIGDMLVVLLVLIHRLRVVGGSWTQMKKGNSEIVHAMR
jgi:hypothetical protein